MDRWKANKSEVAEFFQVSVNTIDDWLRKGCPFVERGKSGKGWVFDVRIVQAWRHDQVVEERRRESQDATLVESTRRKAKAEADLKELELAEKRKELVKIETVALDMGRVFKNMSTRLQAIPVKCAPLLAACRTEAQFQHVISRQIDEALHELSELPFLTDDAVSGGGENVGATAAIDGQPVGRSTPDAEPRKQRRTGQVGHRPGRVSARHT